jgi:hypothetical protein
MVDREDAWATSTEARIIRYVACRDEGKGDESMLMVIFGAGASYDSIRGAPDRIEPDFYRPPLAKDLFAGRRNFGRVLMKFDEAAGLVMELERSMASPDGVILEQELERFQKEAETSYPPRQRQLTAIRFYFQRILWDCSIEWRAFNYGKTNYVDFFTRIDKWRYANGERLALVTFNYDTLADSAFSSVFNRPLRVVNDYVSDDTLSLFKVHGSVNWGRIVRGWEPVRLHPMTRDWAEDELRKDLVHLSQELNITDEFVVLDEDLTPVVKECPVYPAVAIPFTTKAAFECPAFHLRELSRAITEVDRIIVVGWRGNEKHFLSRLEDLPGMAPRVQMVSGDRSGCAETSGNLESAGLAAEDMELVEGGFSNYLQTSDLEDFLARPVGEG